MVEQFAEWNKRIYGWQDRTYFTSEVTSVCRKKQTIAPTDKLFEMNLLNVWRGDSLGG
jgi:hypothetical protein